MSIPTPGPEISVILIAVEKPDLKIEIQTPFGHSIRFIFCNLPFLIADCFIFSASIPFPSSEMEMTI